MGRASAAGTAHRPEPPGGPAERTLVEAVSLAGGGEGTEAAAGAATAAAGGDGASGATASGWAFAELEARAGGGVGCAFVGNWSAICAVAGSVGVTARRCSLARGERSARRIQASPSTTSALATATKAMVLPRRSAGG